MSISGRLEDLGIAGILRFIDLGERSGTLRVESESKIEIHFAKGRIVGVRGSETRCLGELLVEKGLIDRKALLAASVSQKADGKGRALGEVLLSLGVVLPEDLSQAVREHVQATVLRLLAWTEGSFRFTSREAKTDQNLVTDPGDLLSGFAISTQGVLLEAARIMDHERRDDPGSD